MKKPHSPTFMALDFVKYIGPGLLAALAFIDPGNWAANVLAGSVYGYSMLWVITLSTIIFILFQHNAAHLGIATGYCLAETAMIYLKPWIGRTIILTALAATIATAFAEILGSAIALNMLFALPLQIGMIIIAVFTIIMLYTNSYRKIEKWIIGFVSIIGLSFIIELSLVHINWKAALAASFIPSVPSGSMLIIMSVLGAVVMPGNLFLHSEIIQSRQLNLQSEETKEKQLKYEFLDTFFSTFVGWAISCAMIIIAAATFNINKIPVTELSQAHEMLKPLLGNLASTIFALALLLSGVASSVTVGMSGGSIYSGMFKEPYDIHDSHTKAGVFITMVAAVIAFIFVKNPFSAIVYSQTIMSIQLPITIFFLIYVTSSKKIMGKYENSIFNKVTLLVFGFVICLLNILYFIELIWKKA